VGEKAKRKRKGLGNNTYLRHGWEEIEKLSKTNRKKKITVGQKKSKKGVGP